MGEVPLYGRCGATGLAPNVTELDHGPFYMKRELDSNLSGNEVFFF